MPANRLLATPATPLQETNGRYSEEWLFLWQVKDSVPRGRTYSVAAQDLHREMSLYMMSLGLLPKARAIPLSYHGRALAGRQRPQAEYLLVFRCGISPPSNYRLLSRGVGGCVFTHARLR